MKKKMYNGTCNPFIFERIYDLDLGCVFQLENYPFDFQHCKIEVNTMGFYLFIADFFATQIIGGA